MHGARQTGKTTLVQGSPIGQGRAFLSLDDFEVRDVAQSDPAALFIGRDHITLDEIQRQPDLLLAIKADVDRRRQAGRFLLTGSANLLLMERVAETLAGRAVYFSLPPLTWAEIEECGFGQTLDLLIAQETQHSVPRHRRGPRRGHSPALYQSIGTFFSVDPSTRLRRQPRQTLDQST